MSEITVNRVNTRTLHDMIVEVLSEAGLPLDYSERLTARIVTKMIDNPEAEILPVPVPSTYWEYLMSQGGAR